MIKYISGVLILSLGLFISCSKKKDSVDPPSSQNTITATYYIQADISGTTKTFQHNVGGYANGAGNSGTSSSNGTNEYSSIFVKASVGPGGVTYANDNLSIVFNLPVNTPVQTDYDNFFVLGVKTYLSDPDNLNGVYIEWVDESGLIWTSAGLQASNSSFNITQQGSDVVNATNFNWIKATFSCTLYNGANSKAMTGNFKGLILPYQP